MKKLYITSIKNIAKTIILKLFSPSLIALFLALIVVEINLSVSPILNEVISSASVCSGYISMIFIGSVIGNIKLGKELFDRDVILSIIAKIVIEPIVLYLILLVLPLDQLLKSVVFIIMLMPISVNFNILTYSYNCDYKYSAAVSSILNIVCILALPLYIFILHIKPF